MEMNRRSLITGLISLVAAPAIVRVSSIMPVKQMLPIKEFFGEPYDTVLRNQILRDIAEAMHIPLRFLTGDHRPLTFDEQRAWDASWRQDNGFIAS